MRVWITKWATTTGIIEDNCDIRKLDGREYAKHEHDGNWGSEYMPIGIHAFKTREEAKAKAEEMTRKKIESLSKQIDKLKLLKFDQVSVAGRMVD